MRIGKYRANRSTARFLTMNIHGKRIKLVQRTLYNDALIVDCVTRASTGIVIPQIIFLNSSNAERKEYKMELQFNELTDTTGRG